VVIGELRDIDTVRSLDIMINNDGLEFPA